MSPKKFSPGFRFSPTDALFLALGVAATIWLQPTQPFPAFVVACSVGHFFLFCNIFRISRTPEVIWAVSFVCLCLLHSRQGVPTLPWLGTAAFALAAFLIAWETRQPHYHGVFWQKLNPGLRTWWEAQGR